MSVVVHVGQCGVQLGEAFWPLVGTDGPPASRRQYEPQQRLKCIVVDSEPKVVRRFAMANLTDHVLYEHTGRANNWSMGYHFSQVKKNTMPVFGQDPTRDLNKLVLQSLRKAVEATDGFQGVLLMHSLGGGTGSGLGCRMLEEMRDMYPRVYLGTASVAPSTQMDSTALQRYNMVLSLAKLVDLADFVLYKQNDELFRRVGHWKSQSKARDPDQRDSKRVTLQEMNQLAACDIAGLLLPLDNSHSLRFDAIVQDLCPLPTTKFVDTRTAVLAKPESCLLPSVRNAGSDDPSIDVDARKLCLQSLHSFHRGVIEKNYNLATQLVLRGFGSGAFKSVDTLVQLMDKSLPLVDWSKRQPWQHSPGFSTIRKPFAQEGGVASATVCANNGSFVDELELLLKKAELQFQQRAFVHWYNKFGTQHDDFTEAFDDCHRLVEGYRELMLRNS